MIEKFKNILNEQGLSKLIPKIDFSLIENPPEGIINKTELKTKDKNINSMNDILSFCTI